MPVPEGHHVASRSLLRDDAFRALRDAIVDGTLAPGERLVDAELIAWLGVSRTPIREALARLEQAGLVQTRPGRSTTVSPLDVRETRAAQSVAAAMHELAVREAVPQLAEADLEAMTKANGRFAKALRRKDVDAAVNADDDFHGVAVRACGNAMVRTVLDQVTPLVRRAERLRFTSLTGRGSVAVHAAIVELCRAGDADGAGREARANWLTLQLLLATDD
ncbi:GntR family transcriptional regulator [Lapillicoccus jejuensis]|uniref:DNA-binding GntR family transcriptional regulator n=1 Tax=Lapillicoccus jejuensis TaxID=402171 RepID=A0A542E0D7_9MICO|nr:GntR family transcriptional regulator [Lapillicoccus jejuensis]TQJ08810.1 DNA-binding GntR family transcriptional regulator [Lapillicoccus jejuensis]